MNAPSMCTCRVVVNGVHEGTCARRFAEVSIRHVEPDENVDAWALKMLDAIAESLREEAAP